MHAEKQVLIVGAVGSGTARMSLSLMGLGVEVGHEASDSEREYCRDGTISWAHGIRFLRYASSGSSISYNGSQGL